MAAMLEPALLELLLPLVGRVAAVPALQARFVEKSSLDTCHDGSVKLVASRETIFIELASHLLSSSDRSSSPMSPSTRDWRCTTFSIGMAPSSYLLQIRS